MNDTWEPTPHLRWRRRPYVVKKVPWWHTWSIQTPIGYTLEQKWKRTDQKMPSGELYEEWRLVPHAHDNVEELYMPVVAPSS